MAVDPSQYRSQHHIEHCPDHLEMMAPSYVAEEAFPIKYVCPTDNRKWTREELAGQ